jgi:hypothetical protein
MNIEYEELELLAEFAVRGIEDQEAAMKQPGNYEPRDLPAIRKKIREVRKTISKIRGQ